MRENTGVLLERGTELYAFVHLTFQEYFAACDIYRRHGTDTNGIWKEIAPRLHDSHWREIIRLLVAKLDGEFDGIGQKLVERILDAGTLYENLLRRDLFLAGDCLSDDVAVNSATRSYILDAIIDMALDSPYSVQRDYARDMLRDLSNSSYRGYVMEQFATLLEDESSYVRRFAASALGSIGGSDKRVLDVLRDICEDYRNYEYWVDDPEGGDILVYDLAFRTLWRYA